MSRSNILWLSPDRLSVVIMVDLNEFHPLGKKHFSVINPIHTGVGGGGVFHLQASKLLRTPKRNKP